MWKVHTKNAEGVQKLLSAYNDAESIQRVYTPYIASMQALCTYCRHQKSEQHPGAVHKKCDWHSC